MKPIKHKHANVNIAENQDEYLTLPAFQDPERTVSCWKLSWRERLMLLFTGKLWLSQLNFSQALQPILPEVDSPFEE